MKSDKILLKMLGLYTRSKIKRRKCMEQSNNCNFLIYFTAFNNAMEIWRQFKVMQDLKFEMSLSKQIDYMDDSK